VLGNASGLAPNSQIPRHATGIDNTGHQDSIWLVKNTKFN